MSHVLHALGATSPVAVVKVHLLALEDKGADAVLHPIVSCLAGANGGRRCDNAYMRPRNRLDPLDCHGGGAVRV